MTSDITLFKDLFKNNICFRNLYTFSIETTIKKKAELLNLFAITFLNRELKVCEL